MIANIPAASVPARVGSLIMTAFTALLVWGTDPAAAQDCGGTIGPAEPGAEILLEGDIGPCDTDPALTIVGPVSVNLNGFTVSCVVPDAEEGFMGIVIAGFNALVRNGVVEDCEDGVVVDGRPDGGRHVVTKLTVNSSQQQVGNRGFRVRSDGNHLVDNRATRFSGIGFRVDGSDNRLVGNFAVRNQDEGFRIEPAAQNNTLLGNHASNNGATDNEAGVRIRGDGNVLLGNTAIRNFGDGFLLEVEESEAAENNSIIRNISLGNAGTDLVDQNPGCDANRWLKNRARTTSQDCID